jgi:hypothetical protein
MMKTTANREVTNGCGRQEELVAYLYDEAAAAERAAFERHLDECAGCRQELQAFERVRHDLTAWQLPLAPRLEIAVQRGAGEVLRELWRMLPLWPKAVTAAAAVAAMALIAFALTSAQLSIDQSGFSLAFGGNPVVTQPPVNATPVQTMTRAEAEALIQAALARAQAQAQDDTQAQLAGLEERLNAAYQARLVSLTRQLAEQRVLLTSATRQEPTLREWLFAANETRDGGGTENEKND